MKKTIQKIQAIILVLTLTLTLASCTAKTPTGLWENATYTQDTELGNGEKTVTVEVKAEEKTVTFTIKTDKSTVGEALLEHSLIEGEESQYGLYVKKVNGITADYDKNGAYWAFYVDNEYAMSGVDTTEIAKNAVYRLEYAK